MGEFAVLPDMELSHRKLPCRREENQRIPFPLQQNTSFANNIKTAIATSSPPHFLAKATLQLPSSISVSHTRLFSYSTPSCPLQNACHHSMLLAKLLPQHLDVVPPHQHNPAPNQTLSITLCTASPAPATARMHKRHSQGIKLAQQTLMEMVKAGPMNNIYSTFCWSSHSSCSGTQESKAI